MCREAIISAAANFINNTLGGWVSASAESAVFTMFDPRLGTFWVNAQAYKSDYLLNWFFITVEAVRCEEGYYAAAYKSAFTHASAPSKIPTGSECLRCPTGSVCNGGRWLPIPQPSYWVSTQGLQYLNQLEPCYNRLNCIGAEASVFKNCFEVPNFICEVQLYVHLSLWKLRPNMWKLHQWFYYGEQGMCPLLRTRTCRNNHRVLHYCFSRDTVALSKETLEMRFGAEGIAWCATN